MIVLDASVLIAYLDARDAQHDPAEALLAAAVDDELRVNPLTLGEVLVGPVRKGMVDAARAVLHDLEIEELPFPADAALRLAILRASTSLKMPDCCVLMAAEAAGAGIATLDDRLAEAARSHHVRVLTS